MYDAFKNMINELYNNEDFIEYCYVEGFKQKCFVSPIADNVIYTDTGLQSGVNFTLDLNIADLQKQPKEGDKVIFRQKTYKIASTETDSVGACLKLYLIATSRGA